MSVRGAWERASARAQDLHKRLDGKRWYRLRTLTWFVAPLILVLAHPAKAQTTELKTFAGLLDFVDDAAQKWANFLVNGAGGAAAEIFYWCLVLQVVVVGYRFLASTKGGGEFLLAPILFRQLPVLVVISAGLFLWPAWSVMPQTTFLSIGEEVTGFDKGLDPGALIGAAYAMAEVLSDPKLTGYNIPVFLNPLPIFNLIAAVATVLALAAVGIVAFILTIEGNFLTSVGPIFWAFGGFGWTAGLAENYVRYSAKLGIQYMGFMFMVDLGATLPKIFKEELDDIPFWAQQDVFVLVLKMAIVIVAWAITAITVPRKAAAELIHFWTPGFAEALKK